MPIKVVVEPHDPHWAEQFREESARVAQAFGSNLIAIHHIGSTAIPAIYAKPIIDMLVEAADLQRADAACPAIEKLGYEAMGEFGIPGRRYFRKDNAGGVRTRHIHAFLAGSSQIARHLAFRDFMRAHPDWANRYSDLKRSLAQAHPDSIERYSEGKDAFIKEADQSAAVWRAGLAAEPE